MKKFVPPILHAAIIMGDDPILIAQLSALLAKKGQYLPVMDGPRLTRPDAKAECDRRNNAVARSGARKIVMANMPTETVKRFFEQFPRDMTFTINQIEQNTCTEMGLSRRTGEALRWGKANIGVGLLRALQKKVPIEFVDNPVDDVRARYTPPQGDYLVVCEDGNLLSQVIAANYAYSIGAGLFLIDEVGKDVAEELCEEFYNASESRQESTSSILSRLSDRLKNLAGIIPLYGIRGITFISGKIPWGFAFKELPTSHLFSYPDLGIAIINGVAAEQPNSPPMRMAVVVDPATIPSTEVEKMAVALASTGILVRGFRGHNANVTDVLRMTELLPYDLLLIATHCGDASGWRETFRFVDSEGKARTFVMDTAVAVASERRDREKVKVTFFERFVSLDGVDWDDKTELKKILGNSVNDFFKIPPSERHADERKKIERVASSAAMQMYDGNILLTPRALGDNRTPVILNNACTSWHELAGRVMFGNARAYIGTLISVVGVEAEEIADQVLRKHFGKPLANALWHAQNEVYRSGTRRPYLLVGVHYQRLSSSLESAHSHVVKRISRSLSFWKNVHNEIPADDTDRRLSVSDNIEFLQHEIAGLRQGHP
jgi:hypothetical protein